MVHQLGRTELENLVYFFGRTGLSFDRKKLLAPPKKCPRNAYGQIKQYLMTLNIQGDKVIHTFIAIN